mgnify:CR=1 FL=1|jgi:apolipoprotein N-acyltransferase
MTQYWQQFLQQRFAYGLLAVISGALFPLGLAPLSYWPLTLGSMLAIAWLSRTTTQSSFWLGWWYGLGVFGVGVSWVSASMAVSGTPPVLTFLLTALFCAGLALLFGLQFLALNRLQAKGDITEILSFAALWVLFEWLRSWLFTGFPWLYAGYALTDTWAAAFAPLVGVYGLSALMAGLASAWALTLSTWKLSHRLTTLGASLLFTFSAVFLQQLQWVTPTGQTLDTVIIQGNVDQKTKWDFDKIQSQFDRYLRLSQPHTDAAVIVWPEAAITAVASRASRYLDTLDTLGKNTNTSFITGIIDDPVRDGRRHYYNAAMALGVGDGDYYKTRMVPFGEYVPFADYIRGLLAFFDLPLSTLEPGLRESAPIQSHGLSLGLLICYEIAYPAMILARASQSDVIVTLSNDAWFGVTFGPYQHLEMARMRAMEVGRPVIRATQDGVSAFIDHQGQVNAFAPKHQQASIRHTVQQVTGTTPYSRGGYLWIMGVSILLIIGVYWRQRQRTNTR